MTRSFKLLSGRGAILTTAAILLLGLQACASKDSVKQLDARVSQNEASIAELQRKVGNLKVRPRILGRLSEGIHFDTGSATLKDDGRAAIDKFFDGLGTMEDAWVLVVGATDVTGAASLNFALGLNRANAVTKYLVTEKGIEPAFITTRTVGKSRPIGEQATPESLFVNRRVELVVYKFVAVSG